VLPCLLTYLLTYWYAVSRTWRWVWDWTVCWCWSWTRRRLAAVTMNAECWTSIHWPSTGSHVSLRRHRPTAVRTSPLLRRHRTHVDYFRSVIKRRYLPKWVNSRNNLVPLLLLYYYYCYYHYYYYYCCCCCCYSSWVGVVVSETVLFKGDSVLKETLTPGPVCLIWSLV